MFTGLLFWCDVFEVKLTSSATLTVDGNNGEPFVNHTIEAYTEFCQDYLSTSLGMHFQMQSIYKTNGGVDNHSTSVSLGILGESYSFLDSNWEPDLDGSAEIDDVKLFMNSDANYELHYSGGRIKYKGATVVTFASGSVFINPVVPFPCATPFNGLGLTIHPGSAADRINVSILLPPPYYWNAQVECTWTGGYRFSRGGVWYAAPVALPPITTPTITGQMPFGLSFVNLPSATTTWNATGYTIASNNLERFSTYQLAHIYAVTQQITLVPSGSKGVQRLNADYKAMVYRGQFPETHSFSSRDGAKIQHLGGPDPDGHSEVDSTVHPNLSEFLAVVTTAPHVIEEGFGQSYCLLHVHEQKVEVDTRRNTFPELPNWVEALDFNFPESVSTNTMSYAGHSDPRVRYVNTWANPGFSYFLWFPPEDAAAQWLIDGGGATPQSYWLNVRSQHLTHPALPDDEDLKIRNDVISEPLWQNGLAGLMEGQVFGQFTSWWGICRPHVDSTAPDASQTSDDTLFEAITDTDCTTTITNSWITIDTGGSASCVVEIDLGRFAAKPYQYPHIARQVALAWETGNVTSMKVYVVDAAGKKLLLEHLPGDGETTTGYTYDIPAYQSKKYAGSWGQDYGVGYLTDQGIDAKSGGNSFAAMASPERNSFISLAIGTQPAKLRFEVERISTSTVTRINHPVWYRASDWADDFANYPETAMVSDTISKDGPGWRYGQQQYFDYATQTVLSIPETAAMAGMPTVLDWLCFKRNTYLNRIATDDLATEVGDLYIEGIEWTQVKHLASDPFTQAPLTHSFLLPTSEGTKAVLVSSYREMPPLANWPWTTFDDNFNDDEGLGGRSYSYINTTRRVIIPGELRPKLIAPDNTNWLANVSGVLSGWRIGQHAHVVDGSESATWKVTVKSVTYGKVRPWHGYFAHLSSLPQTGGFWNFHTPWQHYHQISADDMLSYSRSNRTIPPFDESTDIDTGGDDHEFRAQLIPGGPGLVGLTFCRDDSDVYFGQSGDDGRTFGGYVKVLDDAKHPTLFCLNNKSTIVAGWRESNSHIVAKATRDLSNWSAEFSFKDGAGTAIEFEDDTFHFSQAPEGPDRLVLVARKSGDDGPTTWWSADLGATWTEI